MCLSYSKLPTEKVTREEKREKTTGKTKTKKQSKWKKVKKAAEHVCDFLFGDFIKLSDANVNHYPNQPMSYSASFALGGVGYY